MTNLPTNYHNFEIQKENIRKFSNKILEPVELKAVDEKFLWKFDHRVTGTEFNAAIEQIQEAFKKNYEISKDIVREFKDVYNTFESLDKDYIQGICASVATAKESAKQALEASNQANDSFEEARSAQERIEKTTNALRYTVEKFQERFEQLDFKIRQQDASIETLSTCIYSELEQQKLLREKITSDLESYKAKIAEQSRSIQEVNGIINSYFEYYNSKFDEQRSFNIELSTKIDAYKEEYQAKFGEQNATIEELNKKIKYAYIVSAVAIIAACANFFVK
ncbi:hypothetical protein [Phascolarctobacterium succinatutens]|uniref:hypothetical protein n=1 Tax=Phascolarctobacterium succinatutens TaxID=626940 RepID=UPI003AB79515